MTKRHVSLPSAAAGDMEAFIEEVDRRLSGSEDTCTVVEDVLVDLHGDREAFERWQAGESVSAAERVRLRGYDPCNTTLESEYYAEVDDQEAQFQYSKHVQWLWRQFDATPMADNVQRGPGAPPSPASVRRCVATGPRLRPSVVHSRFVCPPYCC